MIMTSTWLLLLWFSWGEHPVIHEIEFKSEAACKQAILAIKNSKQYARPESVCIRKR